MDEGTIEYHRNGKSLGEAFNSIERGTGIAYYPAVSLAFNDGLTANFGGSPLKYPIHGYMPLQQPPYKALYQADVLLEYLVNIARLTSSSEFQSDSSDIPISSHTFYMLITSIIVEKLAPLLINSYIVEEKIVKLIKSLCVLK